MSQNREGTASRAVSDFESHIIVLPDDPLCQLIRTWQKEVARIGQYDVSDLDADQDPVTCVKNLRLEIYRYLKTTVDVTLMPQKQITIKAKGAALQGSGNESCHLMQSGCLSVPVDRCRFSACKMIR